MSKWLILELRRWATSAVASPLLALLISSALSISAQSEENEPILVIAGHIESRLDDNPNSGYKRLLNQILPEEAEYRIYPLHRTVRDFQKDAVSCIFPTSIDILHLLTSFPVDHMIESIPIDRVSSHLFTAPNAKVISSTIELAGKSIIVRQGVVEEHINFPGVNKKVVKTVDNQSALRMLLAGRVDALYGWIPDVLDIADEHSLTLPNFDPNLTIYATDIHLTCKKNNVTRALLDQVDIRIQKLKDSGGLREILGKNAHLVE